MCINCARNARNHFASITSFKKSLGLSVIELVVALAITATVSGMAASAYQDAVDKHVIINVAHHISLFLKSVQSQSVKRNRRAMISYQVTEDGAWCLGATLERQPCDCSETDLAAPNYCAMDAEPWVFRDSEIQAKNLVHFAAGEGNFAFDPVRRLFAGPYESVALGLQSGNRKFQLELRLIATGRTALCLPPGSENIRQYETCPQ